MTIPSTDRVLLDVLVVLVAATAAAELAARIGVPAVAAEIVAGILVGPSLLGQIGDDAVLRVLGQLGVLLLLLEVGLQLDLRELGAVGRPAVLVAVTGVAVPLLGMLAVGHLIGEAPIIALFLGAALSATSVGVSARVFSDLRALGSFEARTVLGAAVADDVIGLVILAVVAGLVSGGGITVASVLGVVGLALAFLLVMGTVATRVAPPLFSLLHDLARSPGTLSLLALAFTLAVAELATAARLAPIVGAFVAGLALSRTDQAERLHRELTPVGHLLIPVFFLQVGIDVHLRELLHPQTLGLAAVLVAVAVTGKLVASVGAVRTPGDKLLIGMGMLPRGEVGLIFAALGLRTGVLGPAAYGSLLLAILTTDLVTAPLLRRRLRQVQGARTSWAPATSLTRILEAAVDLAPGGHPPDLEGISPGDGPLRWDTAARTAFLRLLAEGGERSWRLLAATDAINRALPELGAAARRRGGDLLQLDMDRLSRWQLVERVRGSGLAHPDQVLVAAFLLEAGADLDLARRTLGRIGLSSPLRDEVLALVAQDGVMLRAVARPDGLEEEGVIALAARLGSAERARALHLLDAARGDVRGADRRRLDELLELLLSVYEDGTVLTGEAHLAALRAEALKLLGEGSPASRWVERAPRAYASRTAEELARHAALLQVLRHRRGLATSTVPTGAGGWRIELARPERRTTALGAVGALRAGSHLLAADVIAWPGDILVESLLVTGGPPVQGPSIDAALRRTEVGPGPEPGELHVDVDRHRLPWSTRVSLTGSDRPGLVQAVGAALVASDVRVRTARLAILDGSLRGRLEVATPRGRRLGAARRQALRDALEGVGGRPAPEIEPALGDV
jgi:Kef-type K+ transport system membrane component KefB/predicted amino acid-binding ACT domain protein